MTSDIEIPFAKILHPTWEEFQNFDQFMENCDKDPKMHNYGMFKVCHFPFGSH